MNIKEAKNEIKNAVRAYTALGEDGAPLMPPVRQRPILLIGPPGIGKTAIMEQIAGELGIGLVAYTITHHTRQSAIGLPVITKRTWKGQEFSVTEYTMSEIIASVYECAERTGADRGILFIDEINCVSETLHPTMLQFLQCKMFGTHRVPQGWVIVAAGNPREFNRSAREFDIVTLDRVKRITIDADFEPWREYALERGLHAGVVAYLSLKRENFFRARSTSKDTAFVTARGWEDLSAILTVYEETRAPFTRDLFAQYIQDADVASDFALYYELYKKYSRDYDLDKILSGEPDASTAAMEEAARGARIDERMTIAGLLMSGWQTRLSAWRDERDFVVRLRDALREIARSPRGAERVSSFAELRAAELKEDIEAARLIPREELLRARVVAALRETAMRVARDGADTPWEAVEAAFADLAAAERSAAETVGAALERGFRFAENAFGDGPELGFIVEDLTRGLLSVEYIKAYGCDGYFRHCDKLLQDRRRAHIMREIDSL